MFGPYLRRPGNSIISLDVDEEALKETSGMCVVSSCADMPFVDDYFDAVWACAIIEHVREDVVPELIRVTRPGGRVVVVTPNKYSPFDPIKRLAGMRTWSECRGHVRLYTPRELGFFGKVIGETRFLPGFDWFFRRVPQLAHILVLDIVVTEQLKAKVKNRFGEVFAPKSVNAVRIYP